MWLITFVYSSYHRLKNQSKTNKTRCSLYLPYQNIQPQLQGLSVDSRGLCLESHPGTHHLFSMYHNLLGSRLFAASSEVKGMVSALSRSSAHLPQCKEALQVYAFHLQCITLPSFPLVQAYIFTKALLRSYHLCETFPSLTLFPSSEHI